MTRKVAVRTKRARRNASRRKVTRKVTRRKVTRRKVTRRNARRRYKKLMKGGNIDTIKIFTIAGLWLTITSKDDPLQFPTTIGELKTYIAEKKNVVHKQVLIYKGKELKDNLSELDDIGDPGDTELILHLVLHPPK